MNEIELIKLSISMALDYCHKHYCAICPKSNACDNIFHFHILEQDVLDLALKCQKFNAAEEKR